MHALKLYSGVIGAFLSMNEEETWITPNIFAAARCLVNTTVISNH